MENVTTLRASDESLRHPGDQADGNVVDRFPPFLEYVAMVLMFSAVISLAFTATRFASLEKIDKPDLTSLMQAVTGKGWYWALTIILMSLSWSIFMGCIGAIASLGMKAIKVPEIEINFNISDRQLAILRLALGGLFALALTFPFTSDCFIDFCYFIGTGNNLGGKSEESPFLRAFILVSPFLFGFSTSLVMLVIKQLNDGVRAFFGGLGPRSDSKTTSAGEAAK
jgi:hypothetical protein